MVARSLKVAMLAVAVIPLMGMAATTTTAPAGDAEIAFTVSAQTIDCYDLTDVSVRVAHPVGGNSFTDASVAGTFGIAGKTPRQQVEGFCDSADGSLFRIRFMPSVPGDYTYTVTYAHKGLERSSSGRFTARAGKRRGQVRVDEKYPWHFVWEGTGEHYFLNGTTAFFLMGWEDDKVIDTIIERMAGFGVNRLRVLLDGRSDHTWTEPIKPSAAFRMCLNPWAAQRPDDPNNPGFDFTRFNCAYWQKVERMLHKAREKDIVISAILGWNDTKARPTAGSDDERRYFRYAVARLGAYANINWDLGDDCDSFRSEANTHEMGTFLHQIDTYHHLATSHPVNNAHQDRAAEWFGMTSFQQWARPLHGWMLEQRREQEKTRRIIPQLNEEYGYEDHYPSWAPYKPPGASADADRRAAWEISMAGCYQTTGETAKRGTGVAPDTGGGWVNGRGDETMTLLKGHSYMVSFFKAIEWWKAEPHDELVDHGAYCLAEPGKTYVVYLPHGDDVTVKLEPGDYAAQWYDPRSGKYSPAPAARGPSYTSPAAADKEDWVLLLVARASRP